MTSEDERQDEAAKPRGAQGDPCEDPTQSMSSPERSPASGNSSGISDASDTTTWGGAPPPVVPADEGEIIVSSSRAEPESDSDDTEVLVAASATESPPSAPIAPSSSLRPMLLERIEPSLGRGERMRLDATHWRVSLGRAEESDIRLYTASASRDHAIIAGSENGDWLLTPAKDRSVRIDGDLIAEPIVLEIGMNIILGQDHLRCVTEGLDRDSMAASTLVGGGKKSSALHLACLGKVGLAAGAFILIGFVAWVFSTLTSN